MNPKKRGRRQAEGTDQAVITMRTPPAEKPTDARGGAGRARAEARRGPEGSHAGVAEVAAEEELAERCAKLLEAEDAARTAHSDPSPPDAVDLITEATEEALLIVQGAREEASRIREHAMRLLAIAEGEKAESHEIARIETDRAMTDAERLRSEAEEEATRLREKTVADGGDAGRYSRGRKLPRIGANASNLLSEMSGLRASMAEETDSDTG